MATSEFTGVKTFTATRAREREELGDIVTRWIAQHPTFDVTDKVVLQSSDSAFHALSIVIFYRDGGAA